MRYERSQGRFSCRQAIRTLGRTRTAGEFTPVGPEAMRDPRGLCFLADGRLVVAEQARVRVLFPDPGEISQDILSNFMDVMVVHPTRPEYGYCYLGVFSADSRTSAWQWLAEEAGPQRLLELALPRPPPHTRKGGERTATAPSCAPWRAWRRIGRPSCPPHPFIAFGTLSLAVP